MEEVIESIHNLDRRLRELANREPKLQSWQAPTLINSWVNTGAPFATAGYWKDPYGLVHLRGRVQSGSVPSDALVLPVGYRPLATLTFTVFGLGALNLVNVEADGSVVIAAGTGPFSLDNVIFRAEA